MNPLYRVIHQGKEIMTRRVADPKRFEAILQRHYPVVRVEKVKEKRFWLF